MIRAMGTPHRDADFSREVLEDLYAYPRKRRSVAWLLWLFLGWAGGHRFYLGREFTGLAMLFTGGGALAWWLLDGFLLDRMLLVYNQDQALRKAQGRPPRGLDAMPRLDRLSVAAPPGWALAWRARSGARRSIRFAGDVLVLLVSTSVLGAIAGSVDGAAEAVVAVLLLAALTVMGAGPDWLHDLPVARSLQRWIHRLRLFYRYHPPSGPLLLLVRPVTGMVTAPFRAKSRAEVRLYVELGAAFTTVFLLADVVSELVVPAVVPEGSVQLGAFLTGWVGEVLSTFFLVYAFATPIGAVLNRYLLLEDTQRVPTALAVLTLLGLLPGLVW